MLCMHHLSLRLSLLRCFFSIETNLKSLSNRLVTSFLFDPMCCCYMKPLPLIVVWADPCFHVVLSRCAWCA